MSQKVAIQNGVELRFLLTVPLLKVAFKENNTKPPHVVAILGGTPRLENNPCILLLSPNQTNPGNSLPPFLVGPC